MPKEVTYSRLRNVLTELGFEETRRPQRLALKHHKSDTVFLFRPYEDTDRISPAELFVVRKMLDERGLLEPESFEVLLNKTPA